MLALHVAILQLCLPLLCPYEYIKKANKFASDIDRLSKLRHNLRERVLSSPLFDTNMFTKNFQEALWLMWEKKKIHKDF